jgi:hypothetical protein
MSRRQQREVNELIGGAGFSAQVDALPLAPENNADNGPDGPDEEVVGLLDADPHANAAAPLGGNDDRGRRDHVGIELNRIVVPLDNLDLDPLDANPAAANANAPAPHAPPGTGLMAPLLTQPASPVPTDSEDVDTHPQRIETDRLLISPDGQIEHDNTDTNSTWREAWGPRMDETSV